MAMQKWNRPGELWATEFFLGVRRLVMVKYIIKRILWLIPVIIGVITIIFALIQLIPGDIVSIILGSTATEEARAVLRADLGLDLPIITRWARYIINIFTKFDFGTSYASGLPIGQEIASHFPVTFKLAMIGTIVGTLVGMPLGILSALKQYSWFDSVILFFSVIGASLPSFWIALLLIKLFSVNLHWLPAFGVTTWQGWILPVVVNSFGGAAGATRMTRSSMLEVMREDYVRTARAKGQKECVIVLKHMLRNALIPVVTSIGAGLGGALGGNMAIEIIFAIPGLGNYVMSAISSRNYPAMLGGILVMSVTFVVVNLVVDLVYVAIDPRLKTQIAGSRISKRKAAKMLKAEEEA